MALNLKTLAASETGVLELRNGDDTPLLQDNGLPCTVTVYGPGSKAFAAAKAAQQNRLIAKLQRRGGAEESPEAKAKNDADFLASITVAMDGVDYDGLTGRELFHAVYSDPSIGFIAEQVAKFSGDWANFSKGSAKS